MPVPAARSRIETHVGGVAMHAELLDSGTKLPVFVLIHGLGMSGRYMMPTAELLAAHGRVYVPDLPGFGRSGKPAHTLSIVELADALARWLMANSIASPVMIGNSLSAQVIVDFALRHPHRLAAAVLVGPTIAPEARGVFPQIIVDRGCESHPNGPRNLFRPNQKEPSHHVRSRDRGTEFASPKT